MNLCICTYSPEPALIIEISCTDTYVKQKVPLAFDTAHFIYSHCYYACLILFLILCFCLHENIILAYVVKCCMFCCVTVLERETSLYVSVHVSCQQCYWNYNRC